MTKLRLIAENCSYGDLEDQLIWDRIECRIKSEVVKQCLLCAEDLTLDEVISICRAEEQSKKDAQYLSEESASEAVHKLNTKALRDKGKAVNSSGTQDSKRQSASEDHQCDKCGVKHPRKQHPVYSKQCYNCGKHVKLRDKKKVQTLL